MTLFAGTALNQVVREIEMVIIKISVYQTNSILTTNFKNRFNALDKHTER